MSKNVINLFDSAQKALDKLSEEELSTLHFSIPWGYDETAGGYADPDGFITDKTSTKEPKNRSELQKECWLKFDENPQVNTAIRGMVGRLTGRGFGIYSDIVRLRRA